jgi:hypothetical protein
LIIRDTKGARESGSTTYPCPHAYSIAEVLLQPVRDATGEKVLTLCSAALARHDTGGKVAVDNLARVGVLGAKLATDPVRPVTALDHVLVIAKALHKHVEDASIVLHGPALARRPGGPTESGHVGADDVEGWLAGILGLGERAPDVIELVEGSWPPMNEKDRYGTGRLLSTRVDKVDCQVFDFG